MRAGIVPRRMAVALALTVVAPAVHAARAQAAAPCSFERCGLRMEGRFLLRGTPGDTIARPHWWYDARLPLAALASDSSRRLARRFNRDGHRAQSLTALGGLLAVGGLAVAYGHDADWGDVSLVNRGDAAGVWGTRVAVSGLTVSLVATDLWSRAAAWRDRALWAHNQAIARPGQ